MRFVTPTFLLVLLATSAAWTRSKPAPKPAPVRAAPPVPVTGRLSDSRDGKSYRTVVIGKQTWMAQNLDFSAPGTACYENKRKGCEELGRLYPWDAAKSACPVGWRLPTENDWDALEAQVGGPDSAGGNLKSTKGWENGGNGIDTKGFEAIASGNVDKTGLHSGRGTAAAWWTSTDKLGGKAMARSLDASHKALVHEKLDRATGLSVRCLRE
jgi:uncharacterized protein (TIGR02145 family)